MNEQQRSEFVSLAQAMSAGGHGNVKVWLAQEGSVVTGFKKDNSPFRRKNLMWTDGTATCPGTIWGDDIDKIRPGVVYALINPNWKQWQGKLTLAMSFHGDVQEVGPIPGSVPANPNLSLIHI